MLSLKRTLLLGLALSGALFVCGQALPNPPIGTTSGAWSATTLSAVAANTVYGGHQMVGPIAQTTKFGQVTCTTLTTAGTGTNGVLAIRDMTASSTLCSASFVCTSAKDVGVAVFNCNAAPVINHVYGIDLTTACGTTNPTGLTCSIEIIQ